MPGIQADMANVVSCVYRQIAFAPTRSMARLNEKLYIYHQKPTF